MAEVTSGVLYSDAYDGCTLEFAWTLTSQSAENNESVIDWTLRAYPWRDSGYYTTGPTTLYINSSLIHTWAREDMYKTWSKSGQTVIPHESDGSKTFGATIATAIYVAQVTYKQGAWTLPAISRYPSAPAVFTASAEDGSHVAVGDTVTLTWSGASGTITGYQIQRSQGNSGWQDLKTISGSGTSGTTTDTISTTTIAQTGAGKQIAYRIRAMNGSLPSDWKTAAALTMVGGVDVRINGVWKTGTVWVKAGGTWKRARRVWRKTSGTWKESV